MLISYNWIQSYFKDQLPAPQELADIITMGVFEIDGMEEKDGDTIFDVKVLPDRSGYALSHRYMAQEIGALIKKDMVVPHISEVAAHDSIPLLSVTSAVDETLCARYAGRIVHDVTVTDSPAWLKKQLEVLGQRSINNIVDLTNYCMLETGQPLHAFDADKVEGGICVRKAKAGEEITLLDGTVLTLEDTMLVIADDALPLALAGIKGGKKAEVTRDTKNIILEAACFNGTVTRKTSTKVGIKNDSSKRFENGVTAERAGLAMALLSSKIAEVCPQATFGQVKDLYPNPVGRVSLQVSVAYISQRLGIQISKETIIEILTRVDIAVSEDEKEEDILILSIPEYRTDVRIVEDVVEEVGRLYGYDQIVGVAPVAEEGRRIHKNTYYHTQIRNILTNLGFSEVYTYSLVDSGTTKLANPLTVERAYLRDNISYMLSKKALFNLKNVDLLGLKEVRIFEIGKIFSTGVLHERYSLALTIARGKQPKGHDPKAELQAILGHIETVLGAHITNASYTELQGDAQTPCSGYVVEVELQEVINTLRDPQKDIDARDLPQVTYVPVSQYPFSVRDIAVFVPGEKGQEQMVLETIVAALDGIQKKHLLVRKTLFDVFTKQKEGEQTKTSYAYRLVFQSYEKTLGEEEITECMTVITTLCKEKGFEVR